MYTGLGTEAQTNWMQQSIQVNASDALGHRSRNKLVLQGFHQLPPWVLSSGFCSF